MPSSPLPRTLQGHAILTSDGPLFGVTRQRLRGRDIPHPFHGVSSHGLDLASVRERCHAFLPAMERDQVFSHTTALALHGAPLPELDPALHVSVAFPRTPPRRDGIRGHSLTSSPVVMLSGLPAAPAVVAWAQSAMILDRIDLVAVGDHLAAAFSGVEALASTADSWANRPGHRKLLWAVARVRLGVRSRPESHLRLLLMRARLPEPVVAHPVVVEGGVVLHPDLAYPDVRLAIEYEGEGHRDPRRWEHDIERRELLADARWRTIRVTKTQLYGAPASVVARVRRRLTQ